ncbi:Nuclear polyadenylated RNA-binding protein NAB2 [Pleurostoma richardsiae]|uniref:Nuclear polyadenylated RNA-binding protein NAB2 n=1 Tax=Pleurostoma richardsiae TaxID=41990 RepID=A0AA38RUE1_9PEZI|nr:Nuclear polyadenylated RNA-binding protein NAB2 [Pleurostoma richardsiae]
MSVEIALNTPMADALNAAIQPKLVEVGWGSGGADDAALAEYIILMLVNGKTQDEIASELSGDLLNLGSDDPGAREFARWLFEQIDVLNTQLGGSTTADATAEGENMAGLSQGESTTVDGDQDMEMNTAPEGPAELNVPTGPKSMRNGNNNTMRGGGREKRMMGQISRAMDRSHDSVLHRVRGAAGNERINSHARGMPTGPRMGTGRQPRNGNARAASIAHGMAAMGGPPSGPAAMNGGMNGAWPMMPANPQDIFAMMEQQSRMLQQMQEQLAMQQQQGFRQPQGKSLFDRVQRPHQRNNTKRGSHQQNDHSSHFVHVPKTEGGAEGEDVEMGGEKREPPNPEETVCRFNLSCTNKDCKFAHQSPAAPPGVTIDVNDVCSFGVACKNRKCVGRHPSPATKVAHQSEQDCKFWPNCQNPRCPFKHPSKPPCRNGGDCKVPGCEFTHTKVMCKFHPCTNRYCTFKHEEGQRGVFPDKVWTADGGKEQQQEHVSERKFVDEKAPEDVVVPGSTDAGADQGGMQEVTVG